MPRSVPDVRSLRLRTLMMSPYPALVTALLLHHRRAGGTVRLRRGADGWSLFRGRHRRGPVLRVLDRFALQRGWVVCRRDRPGADLGLLESLEAMGVVALVADIPTVAEPFFAALRTEAEELEVAARLWPLADALADFVESFDDTPDEAAP
jgi:hypothetical protein